MATYQEKYDWYMNEVKNHAQLTALARAESIKAEYNFITPPPPALLDDAAFAEWWANTYDDVHGPWPPKKQ